MPSDTSQLRVITSAGGGPRIVERADHTLVDKRPAQFPSGPHHERGKAVPAKPAPVLAPDTNVIPFARPRAISSLPTTFSPAAPVPTKKVQKKSPRSTPATGIDSSIAPPVASTWGSANKHGLATTPFKREAPALSPTVVAQAPSIPSSTAHAM